ncbi:hypothetical protein [Agromyces bauzanensis]|uniref:Uncharacterized protein n=1 Tax=Agromyces bauzanensis TaxID=1308924 RepID=A0A917P8K1_9MICO|nr:hypothetical protein [Agromyces bauzanensis]GGJ66775.1 hypothetical protein GCM10011372_00640 [Agromyces bauzanensis]
MDELMALYTFGTFTHVMEALGDAGVTVYVVGNVLHRQITTLILDGLNAAPTTSPSASNRSEAERR